jgi:hypothetical protein
MGLLSLTLVVALAATGAAQNPPPDIPPPPNVLASFSEEQLLGQMTERQRALVSAARNPRERFVALVDASDLQLQDVAAGASGASTTLTLQLYEATILMADRRLRSPEAAVKPRDRLFKRFEQRLNGQLLLFKAIMLDLAPEHVDAGRQAIRTAKKIRLDALASAIDADPSILRRSDDDEEN